MASAREILAISSADERVARVVSALKSSASASELATAFVEDAVLVGVSKPLLLAMANYAADDDCDADSAVQICESLLKVASRKASVFGDVIVRAREVLADVYESGEQTQQALNVLLGMPTEPGLRSSSDEYKASLYVRIADLSLDMDNITQAESYVNRAWALIRSVKDDELKLKFDLCQATVLEVKRKFLEAAQRFYTLSLSLSDGISALRQAIVSIVLEDAGPKRSRLIATIFRDERTSGCGELGAILSKVYHQRVLRAKDVSALDPFLKPHHKAIMRDGRTVFENAITQHNLLSASKLYFNISFNELGVLLGVDPVVAERITAQMVAEDRLQASIDQINEVILFLSDNSAVVEQWDSQIAAVCHAVSAVADDVTRRFPAIAVVGVKK